MKKLNKATMLLLSSLLLLVITLMATFSWFPRVTSGDDTYGKLGLSTTAVIKSDTATVTTYECEMVNGNLEQKTALSNGSTVTIPANGTVHFRSIISDTAAQNSTSLTGLKLSGGSGITVCVLSPLKTSEAYSEGMTLIEHIQTKGANSGGVVEWYLYNSGGETTVTLTQLPQISSGD